MKELQHRCISCEIVAGQKKEPGGVLYQDACWHVGSVLEPVVWRGLTILKLRRHCEHLSQLTSKESARLGLVMQATCQAVMDVLHPEKVFVASFGDGVRHVHFWILPRPVEMLPGMHSVLFNLDLRLALTRVLGVKSWLVPSDVVAETAAQLRTRLSELLDHRQDDGPGFGGSPK